MEILHEATSIGVKTRYIKYPMREFILNGSDFQYVSPTVASGPTQEFLAFTSRVRVMKGASWSKVRGISKIN